MGMMIKPIKRLIRPGLGESGQAIFEYLLMVALAIAMTALMATSFRKTLLLVWGYYIQNISAACPGCPPNPAYRFR
jgi:hypothetical protein